MVLRIIAFGNIYKGFELCVPNSFEGEMVADMPWHIRAEQDIWDIHRYPSGQRYYK